MRKEPTRVAVTVFSAGLSDSRAAVQMVVFFASLLSAVPVSAQEPYTVNATADHVSLVESGRLEANRRECVARALPATCSQAEADAVRPGATIYAATAGGRQRYFISRLSETVLSVLKIEDRVRRKAVFCAANPGHEACE